MWRYSVEGFVGLCTYIRAYISMDTDWFLRHDDGLYSLRLVFVSLASNWPTLLRLGTFSPLLEATIGPSYGQASVLRNNDHQQECSGSRAKRMKRTALPKYAA